MLARLPGQTGTVICEAFAQVHAIPTEAVMPMHPLFQKAIDAHFPARPYRLYDDAQWPDLPDVDVVTDDGGACHVVHDVAKRDRDDTHERLHRPGNPFR
jgi:hypothetical protein